MTSLTSGLVQISSGNPLVKASKANRAAPKAGPISDPSCLSRGISNTEARIFDHRRLREPPPISETSLIFAPASRSTCWQSPNA
ncbi:uncharacterized protein METZ01_LOCUS286934 [marine metagenome]|uniref:Uncharacterized protein n=1 Tax=marine metagenome TaxID=408172 RepID=A0A382LBN6_9ZZZZ